MNFMYRNETFKHKNMKSIKQENSKCIEHKKIKSHRKPRETSEERKIRREKDRLRIAAARARETIEERNARLAIERERKRTTRARENSESKEIRNAKNRMRQTITRANETFVEAQARKINDRIRHIKRRSRETLEEREIRLAKDRARHRKYRYKTIQKVFITESNNFCAEIPSDINNQVEWLGLREPLINIKHSSQSVNNIDKEEVSSSEFQIKEEFINLDEESAEETKIPLNIKIEPNCDSVPEITKIKPFINNKNKPPSIIKEDNFIDDNVEMFYLDNEDPLNLKTY